VAERHERLLEEADRLPVRELTAGLRSGPAEVVHRLVPHLATIRMLGEALDLLDQSALGKPFHHLDDLRVEISPAFLQETAVRHLMRERVLEGVFELWKEARLVHELRGLEIGKAGANFVRRQAGNCFEKIEGYVLADDRGDLQQKLLVRGQSIDTSRQYHLHRGWDLNHLERLGQPIRTLFADETVSLGEGPDALFQEERIALGAVDQKLLERFQTRIISQ
jgi:hypothetical protein